MGYDYYESERGSSGEFGEVGEEEVGGEWEGEVG